MIHSILIREDVFGLQILMVMMAMENDDDGADGVCNGDGVVCAREGGVPAAWS